MPPVVTDPLTDAVAADIRRAVYLASARAICPERNLIVVMDRIAAIEAVIRDLAAWIVDGVNRP